MKTPRSCIPCERIEIDSYDWYKRHDAKLKEVSEKQADIIFIGDSITHFWKGEDEHPGYGNDIWQEYYGDRNVINLGYGYDRTQNMLWRIQNGELENQSPKLIVVNAGTNQFSITPNYDGDTPEIAFAGVRLLLKTLREYCPQARIIVMSVFPRMSQNQIQEKIDALNKLVKEYLAENSKNDPEMFYLDITAKMRNPDGSFNPEIYCDGVCHPNSAGYRIWAEALEPEIRKLSL